MPENQKCEYHNCQNPAAFELTVNYSVKLCTKHFPPVKDILEQFKFRFSTKEINHASIGYENAAADSGEPEERGIACPYSKVL